MTVFSTRPMCLLSVCLSAVVVFSSGSLASQAVTKISETNDKAIDFNYGTALEISQQAIGNLVGDYEMLNTDAMPISLNRFRGKPLVLSLIYTSCHQICPMTTRHLSTVVEKARKALGHDSFSVAIVGFDTEFDTPETMRYFANKQGVSDSGWSLLSGKQSEIEQLSEDVGFQYFPSSNGFDHLIQATIIDAEGKVYRQVYGQVFDTPLFVDPLIQLVLGRSAPGQSRLAELGSKIKLFCTTYDPVRDGYFYDYSLFFGMFAGGSIILFTGTVVVRGFRKG